VDASIDLAHMSSESVDEDNLHISNSGSNGNFLSKQSGDAGGLTWAAGGSPSITDNGNANAITISSDEEVTMPSQPSFLVRSAATITNVTGNNTLYTVSFDTEKHDQANNFVTTTFTAPITGKYILCGTMTMSGITTSVDTMGMQLFTSNLDFNSYRSETNGFGLYEDMSFAVVADMDAGDTADLKIRMNGAGSDVCDVEAGGYTTLSGCLLA